MLAPIEAARTCLSDILYRKLEEAHVFALASTVRLEAIKEILLYLKLDVRLYAIMDAPQVETLWEHFRDNESRLDILMELTTEWLLRLGVSQFEALLEALSVSYSYQSKPGVMDSDTFHRLPTPIKLQSLFKENPWLATLYILSTVPFPNGLYVVEKAVKGKISV
jgi:hypothetical protein